MSDLSKIHRFVEVITDDMLHKTTFKLYTSLLGIVQLEHIDYGFLNNRLRFNMHFEQDPKY